MREGVGPAGWTALHVLGLTTQVPSVDEVAVLGPAPARVSGTLYRSRSNPERAELRFYEIAALEAFRLAPAPNSAESRVLVEKLRELTSNGAVRWKKLHNAAEKENASRPRGNHARRPSHRAAGVTKLRDHPDDLAALVSRTSEATGIRAAIGQGLLGRGAAAQRFGTA